MRLLAFIFFTILTITYLFSRSEKLQNYSNLEQKTQVQVQELKESKSKAPITKLGPKSPPPIQAPLKTLPGKGLPAQSPYHHAQLPGQGLVITSVTIDGDYLIAHGDLIVALREDLEELQNSERPLILPPPNIWPNGRVPYLIEAGLPNKADLYHAFQYFEKNTPVRFVPKSAKDQNYVMIKAGQQNCYSNLGMLGGEQTISLHQNCDKRKIIHELMHTLGFLHEQNREDRDDYINILWENIDEANWLQFKIIKNDFQDLSTYDFDFKSIMLYSSDSFSLYPSDYSMVTINGDAFFSNPNTLLSPIDLQKLNLLYSQD